MKDLSGEDIANYAVCPESWRLKRLAGKDERIHGTAKGSESRKEWAAHAELRQQLRKYTKIIFALLAALTGVIILLDSFGSTSQFIHANESIPTEELRSSVPTEIGLLLLVVGLLIFVWDLFDRRVSRLQKESGLGKDTELLSVRGSSMLPGQILRSKKRKLFSKPYALLKEDRQTIPVDMYPMSNKVHDRHVLPLILHLALLEEQTGIRAEYGVVLMGKKRKRVQIANTEEKQRWLASIIDEMRSIESGVPAIPAPTPRKCSHCDVEKVCEHSLAGKKPS